MDSLMSHFMHMYCGWERETVVPVAVVDVGCGAGETTCRECGGTGDWPYMPDGSIPKCVPCKGSGKVLISI